MNRFTLLLASTVSSVAIAQPYTLAGTTIDGGGGISTTTRFELAGSIGQHDTGASSGAGRFTVTAGFWRFGETMTQPDPIDFDGNGVVNISDLFAFINAFTMTPPDPNADFDGNGVINISDLFAFIQAFTSQP
ncbi:MAG: GC-type dockerin domain-anchored protein [Planctomycetota bacterium]